MATFSDVIKKHRKEGSGRTGALFSAMGEKTLEAIDPRRMFDQSGVLTALFPSLKAYQAKGASDKSIDKLSAGDAATKVSLEEMIVKLDSIDSFSRSTAKNTLVLPSMARDTYLVKQNIIKLVKAMGGKPQETAGDWFNRQMAREAAFEEKFSKTKPEKITEKKTKEEDGGFLSSLFAPLMAALSPIIKTITSFGTSVSDFFGIAKILSEGMGILRIALAGLLSPIGLVVAALAAIPAALAWWLSKNDKGVTYQVDEMGNVTGGSTPDMSSVMGQGEPVSTADMVKGTKSLPEAIRQTQAEDALELGRKAAPDDSYSKLELMRANRGPTPSPTSPSKVSSGELSEDLVNQVKKLEGFRENAYWDNKQYSIGYGTKANSPDEKISEEEADRRLREELLNRQKYVLDFAKKHNYDWNQSQVDSLTSFIYNLGNKALDQLTAGGTRTNEEIAEKIPQYNRAAGNVSKGLVSRRSTELAMFTGLGGPSVVTPTPSTGTAVASASSTVAETRMSLSSAAPQPVIVQSNNTSNPPQPTQISSATSAWDPFMLENIVLNKT